jgi:hypothetical protein
LIPGLSEDSPLFKGTPRAVPDKWEPIKILLEGDGDSYKTNTASNTLL